MGCKYFWTLGRITQSYFTDYEDGVGGFNPDVWGIGGIEWHQNTTNPYQTTIEKLYKNAIDFLKPTLMHSRYILSILEILLFTSCKKGDVKGGTDLLVIAKDSTKVVLLTESDYRPVYHYTPPRNWMNDPNGFVYYNGQFRLTLFCYL